MTKFLPWFSFVLLLGCTTASQDASTTGAKYHGRHAFGPIEAVEFLKQRESPYHHFARKPAMTTGELCSPPANKAYTPEVEAALVKQLEDVRQTKVKSQRGKDTLLSIPLQNIWECGGYEWTSDWHKFFASIDFDSVIEGISPKVVEKWNQLPLREALDSSNDRKCEVVGLWIQTKERWNLQVTPTEHAVVTYEMKQCQKKYDRVKHFGKWIDEDGDCQKTNVEALVRDADPKSISFKDKKQCKVKSGKWEDLYAGLGHSLTTTNTVDIDHVVPLKNAFVSGAWCWSQAKRVKYANYIESDRELRDLSALASSNHKHLTHLLATSASENRRKGDKAPQDYMPPNKNIACSYALSWVRIKKDWDLDMDPESDFLEKLLSKCD